MKKLMMIALTIGLALGFSTVQAGEDARYLVDENVPSQAFNPVDIYTGGELIFAVMGLDTPLGLALLADENRPLALQTSDPVSIYAQGGLFETRVAGNAVIIDMGAPVTDRGEAWWKPEFSSQDGVPALY